MALKFGFFNSSGGDRLYSADDIGRYLQGIISSGVYADTSTSLQVLSGGGMEVLVQPGRGMLDYHYLENTEPLALTLSNGGTLDRIDAIVMRLDLTNRLCEIAVKEGTPAATPKAPTMSRTDVKKEYMLASVYVTKLATSITQENITDTRADNTVCGWVHGLIDQVDTAALFAQYQAAYAAELANMRTYAQAQRQAIADFVAALTEELQVYTYIQEYRNSVTIEEAGTTVLSIGISDYVPEEDVLLVNLHGLLLQATDYTVTGTGGAAVCTLNVNTTAGHVVEFRVLKSKIGSAAMTSTLALDGSENVLTDDGTALSLE